MQQDLTINEAAELAGFRPGFLYKECREGRLAHYRHGWVIRISPSDLDAWRQSRRVTTPRPVKTRTRPVRERQRRAS